MHDADPSDLGGILAALVAEGANKSGVAWLTLPSLSSPRAVWHTWHDGALHVVGGGSEQPLPGLDASDTVDVTLRSKDTGGRLVAFPARVVVLSPADERYPAAVAALAADRLNAASAEAHDAWDGTATVFRLEPVGPVAEHPGAYEPVSHAAAPPASNASTAGLRPLTLHRPGRRRPPLT
jgi:hypothetical protein